MLLLLLLGNIFIWFASLKATTKRKKNDLIKTISVIENLIKVFTDMWENSEK